MTISIPRSISRKKNSKQGKAKRRSLRHGLGCESLEIRCLLTAGTWEANYDLPSNAEVASDQVGNAIVANSTSGQLNIRKFDLSGQELWTTSFEGFSSGRVTALEINTTGEIIVAGRFEGTVDFDPGSGETLFSTAGTDGFIASYQDNGASISLTWAHMLGDGIDDIAVDSNSNVVSIGKFETSLNFDSTPLQSSQSSHSQASFVSQIDSSGSLAWVRQIEEAGIFQPQALALDATDNVYISGNNSSPDPGAMNPQYPSLMVDGQLPASGGDRDGYVLKFGASEVAPSLSWIYHFGEGSGHETAKDIEFGSDGSLYVLGRDAGGGGYNFGGTSYSQSASTVVGKVSVDANAPVTEWVQLIQPQLNTNTAVLPTVLDVVDNSLGSPVVYVGGYFAGSIDFDPGLGTTWQTSRNPAVNTIYSTTPEGFVMGLDVDGQLTRAWQLGYQVKDLSASVEGNVHVLGVHISEAPHLITGSIFPGDGSFVVGLNTEQPTVVITPPGEIRVGDSVTIAADAYDLNHSDISGSIVWTDSAGSTLGSGSSLNLSDLSVGNHKLTATAADGAGRNGTFSFDLRVNAEPIAIPDDGTLIVSKTVNSAEAVVIDDVNVTLDISHERKDNVDVVLIAPDGTRVELFTDIGGRYGPGFLGTTLDSEAADPITNGGGNFNWTYRPEGDLSVLNGKNSEGTWSLEITDDRRRDTGTLNWWSLDISGSPAVPNDPPVINSLPVTTATQDVAYTYDVEATDPDAGSTLTYSLETSPSGMTIDSSTGVISWTPNNGQVGTQSVTVRVEDQPGGSDIQSFVIDVANVNDAPVAIDDSFDAEQGMTLNVNAAGILANDNDADGDTLSVVQFTQPPNGTVVVNADGSFSYTPNSGFVGSDSFTYQVSDGVADGNFATVNLEVAAASTDEALYVYDIRFESKRGNKDWRAIFEIRSDSNANGIGDSNDNAIAGVAITVTFDKKTYSGVTDSDGQFRTSWLRNVSSRDYDASVDSLMASGFDWNPLSDLNREDDSDGDGFPDNRLSI